VKANALRRLVLPAAAALLVAVAAGRSAALLIDDFETLDGWNVITSDGAHLEVVRDIGYRGRGMRLDFDFEGGGGYMNVQKKVSLDLPSNYAFAFYVRGHAPPNNFEFKILDESGKNVWWRNRRNYAFPAKWQEVHVKKSQLEFAWGPSGGAPLTHVSAIEFTIAAGSGGGKGSVWIDEIHLEERGPSSDGRPPLVTASTSLDGFAPERVLDEPSNGGWKSEPVAYPQWLQLDFGSKREYGGLVIDWDADDYPTSYQVLTSNDGRRWSAVRPDTVGNGGRDYVYMPDTESRYLKIDLDDSSRGQGYGIRSVSVRPFEFSASPNRFIAEIARDSPLGWFPKYFVDRQTYWTVVGVDGDDKEALLSDTGALEVDDAAFTVEPFLYAGGRLMTWADWRSTPSLRDGNLPIPSVVLEGDGLRLEVTAFAAGAPGASVAYARYTATNTGSEAVSGNLFLTLRPFQVNPPWQSLHRTGGVAPIHDIRFEGDAVRVDDARAVVLLTPVAARGAATFAEGVIPDLLARGAVPSRTAVTDASGYASAAMSYSLRLSPGESRSVDIAVPLHDPGPALARLAEHAAARREFDDRLAATEAQWRRLLSRVAFRLPPSAQRFADTVRSTLAYILINRDGPAIQPGSRNYARSWIRDGAVTSVALLQMGFPGEVRDFLRWFAGQQFASGKVPCCSDDRGPDPTPENDSQGEFIYAVAEYYRFTGDVGFVADMWPHVAAAADYTVELRAQRLTPDYDSGDRRLYRGLMPESISHEGYSSNPVHSYWDDFFALRGLRDAAFLAAVYGDDERAARYAKIAAAMRADVGASVELAMRRHDIDYVPGAAELGDFDPSSTAIALGRTQEAGCLPPAALRATFERYYRYFDDRRNDRIPWEGYAPYEVRNAEALLELGEPARAFEVLQSMVADQRPPAWNQWQEIVWRDPAAPKFIGDMPHTWIGAEFILALRAFFAAERAADRALVIGAGLPPAWIDDPAGVAVERLPTHYGTLNLSVRRIDESTVRVALGGDLHLPPGGLAVQVPVGTPLVGVDVNGRAISTFDATAAEIETFPAEVVLHY